MCPLMNTPRKANRTASTQSSSDIEILDYVLSNEHPMNEEHDGQHTKLLHIEENQDSKKEAVGDRTMSPFLIG